MGIVEDSDRWDGDGDNVGIDGGGNGFHVVQVVLSGVEG